MQYKSLVNPSFLILMMEVQDHLREGWYIDENNYPTANFTYYEVHLIRDEHREAVKDIFSDEKVFDSPDSVLISEVKNDDFGSTVVKKQAGRPPRVKQ